MDWFRVFFFIFQFILLFLAERLIGAFYTKRRTTLKVMMLSLFSIYLAFCLQYIMISYLAPSLLKADILVIFMQCFLITLNYKSSLIRRFAAAFSVGIYLLLSIIIIGGLIVPLILPNLQVGSDEWSIASNLLFLIAGFTLSKSLNNFKSIKKKAIFSRIAIVSPLLGFLIVILIFSIPIVSTFGIDIAKETSTIIVLIFISWFLFSSLFMYDIVSSKYEDKLKLDLQAQEKEYYYSQCQLMNESVEQVRMVRHDIVSHLATLKEYTISGNIEAMSSYLDSLISDIKKSEVYSDTGNIAIDSIINYKLQNAKKENIELDINISVPPELNVEVVDIVTIIGNLLDNALDAVAKVNEKLIKLEVKFIKGSLFAKIENSFNGEIKYENNNEKKSIISLKKGNDHGYGLKNIRQTAEKYNGFMKISHTDNIFSTGVFLYTSDK